MATRDQRLQAKQEQLRAQIDALQEERDRIAQNQPDTILHQLFEDDSLAPAIAAKVYELTGNDPAQSAKLLKTTVSKLHTERKKVAKS